MNECPHLPPDFHGGVVLCYFPESAGCSQGADAKQDTNPPQKVMSVMTVNAQRDETHGNDDSASRHLVPSSFFRLVPTPLASPPLPWHEMK